MKYTYLLLVTFLFIALMLSRPATAFNPKAVEYMDVEITESGTLTPSAPMQEIILTLYLPFDYTDLEVQADSYEITKDNLGNELIQLKWTDVNKPIKYAVKTRVKNYAQHLTNPALRPTETASSIYLKKGNGIEFTDFIKQTAFPYKHTLEKIAELTEYTHKYIQYDKSYVGQILSTSEILSQKKGVCVEYTTLLTSLLRAGEIPTRFVAGYAYSDVDKTFIGHTWIEVLMEDGSWLAVDPTWMEMGYIDATHIKTAHLLENKQTETVKYKTRTKNANIEWTKNDPIFNIIDMKEKTVHQLHADALQKQFAPQETGYILGTVSADECSLISLRAVTCVDKKARPMLNLMNPDQVIWMCSGTREVYWFFNSTGNNYICPITIFDQENSVSNIEIEISGSKDPGHATIKGPTTVLIDENFTLEAGIDSAFFFYSTKFGKYPYQKWTISLDKPGQYDFYLYSDGILETKTINVVAEKEFKISANVPQNATAYKEFPIILHITNLAQNTSLAQISIEFEDRRLNDIAKIKKGQSIELKYNLTATQPGLQKLTVSAYNKTISSYTADILVIKKPNPLAFLDAIAEFFASIIQGIIEFFASIF